MPGDRPQPAARIGGMSSSEGYAAALQFREQRLRAGWRSVGRKIGFTNRSIWARYGVHQPIWGTVFDRTLLLATHDSCVVPLQGLSQPRIEPEVCFKLKAAPRSSHVDEVLGCLEWMAHSIEIVQCDQPGWATSLAHSTAMNGLHGCLVVGTPVPVSDVRDVAGLLPGMALELIKGETVVERGAGKNVLGSPLLAMGHLVELLASQPEAPPLAAGEIVSTGTLTDAHPVSAGETWHTRISGIPLGGLTVAFA
jgi:2-oxo-3-hexenedioate decarboxylase